MTTTQNPATISIVSVAAAVIYGIVVATGFLSIVLAIAAMLKGYSIGELYAEMFPRYRGPSGELRVPSLAYAAFFLYVIGAAEVAILYRRRIASRWRK